MFKVPVPTVIFIAVIILVLAFCTGFSFAKLKSITTTPTPNSDSIVSFTPTKIDKPELQFFVMSFCPFGNQMESILRPVFDLLGSEINMTPHYIFNKIDDLNLYCQSQSGDINQCSVYVQNKYFPNITECRKVIGNNLTKCQNDKAYLKSPSGAIYASLHGRQEATQNIREICAWNILSNDKKPWWNFVGNINKNCTPDNADSCWEDQAKQAGLDTTAITDCFNKDGINLIEKELALTKELKVSSSPTLFINGQIFPPSGAYTQDNRGLLKMGQKVITQNKYRTPDVIKEAICAGSKSSLKKCATVLSQPTGITTAAGGCGI